MSIQVNSKLLGTLCVNGNDKTYFENFEIKYIPSGTRKFPDNKNIIKKLYRIQTYDLIVCTNFCIGLIDYIFYNKRLAGFTNLFSPNNP